jgi:hypothetical protein
MSLLSKPKSTKKVVVELKLIGLLVAAFLAGAIYACIMIFIASRLSVTLVSDVIWGLK